MKKLLCVLLVALVLGSTYGMTFRISSVNAQVEWPGIDLNSDGEINVYDAVEYMKANYVGYDEFADTYKWSFMDPYDTTMANNVIKDSLEVERIRDSYKDATVASIIGKSIGLEDFSGVEHPINSANDAAAWVVTMIMKDKSYIMQVLHPPLEWIANNHPDILSPNEASAFSSDLADYMVQTAEDWLQKISIQEWNIVKNLKFDTSLSDKLGKYAGKIKLVFTLKRIVDASIKHILVLWEIAQSNIMSMIKSYEYYVEVFKWIVDVLGDVITDAVSKVAASKGAAALMVGAGLVTANPAIAVGVGIVGYFAIKHTVDDALSAVWDWAIDEATTRIEVLKMLNPLYKFINLEFTGDARVPIKPAKVKIIRITDESQDYIIPWGDGKPGEDIEISVVNTGVQEINLRITPSDIPTNWEIDDKEFDGNNYVQHSLGLGESKSFIFHVVSYTKEYHWWDPFHLDGYIIHPGENPGVFNFKFEHDEHLDWWDIGDWVPGGLFQLFETDVSETFFNSVDFEVTAIASKMEYTRGETAEVVATVKNCRATRTHFYIAVIIRDPHGESEKYSDQITVVPDEETLDPSQSADFTASWTVPSDALVGEYQIGVVLWEDLPHVGACRLYIDNLEWRQIFSVYQMYIVYPTTSQPADAGDYEGPQRINAFAAGLPSYLWIRMLLGVGDEPIFATTIGAREALEVTITHKFAGFGLSILPPSQDDEGLYDLTISVTFGDVSTSASQLKAVKYTKAMSTEPIQKGLEWLRTRQYGDGSWRGQVGVTALSVLAFLNAGFDETDSDVDEAIQYLLSKAHGDGTIYRSYPTYETSLALIALLATHNSDYQATIDAARDWLVNSQWDENCVWGSVSKGSWYYGGFGYGWNTRPDLSNSQFALLALDAAGLPKDDPLWTKAQVFLHRSQNLEFLITLSIEGSEYTVQPYNHFGGYDGGFIYYPGASLAGGQKSYGSMTGAGVWGLLLSGVPKTDERVVAAMNWVKNHFTWDANPGIGWWRPYYYYLSMSKALTMYGQTMIDGHDWYQELYDKIVGIQIDAAPGQGYWSTSAEDYNPELTTAYAILSLQTRAVAPPVQRLSYLTFILRSNCLMRIIDSEGNLVGYNYMTGLGENQIPTAVYSGPFSEPQYIVIINPEAGTYDLELIGISEGTYELTIQGNYGEEVTDLFEYTGEIGAAELHGTDVTVTAIVGPVDVYAEPPEFEEIIDNTPPSINVLTPREDPPEALMDGVTLEANVADPSGVDWVTFSIRETDGSIIDPMFESMSATHIGDDSWQIPSFNTYVPGLPDGFYLLFVNASDMLGNEGSKIVLFSIRNWACLELLPTTESNKAGRTMPVKFSLRVFEIVDPAMPFVYNEELTIVIYEAGDPDNILQTSTYGDTARDYRIDSTGELYITNFRTIRKNLTTYVVEIYRKDMLIGSFTFETVK